MNLSEHPHKRYNPLLGEWVKVSPHRTKRPCQGQVEKSQADELPQYDETCYLCPGNERAGGLKNPDYTGTFAFDNDFSAILPDTPKGTMKTGPGNMIQAESEQGICRVVCFSPRHDLTLARMDLESITAVIKLWKEQYIDLGSKDFINHIQIFENRGAVMGCSNPHPHGQIWAENSIPDIPAKELKNQKEYYKKYEKPLLMDYLEYELEQKTRIVLENPSFVILVPFWAVWPYEVMLLPKRSITSIVELTIEEQKDLADIIKRNGIMYDNLFSTSFPYSMGIHQAPTDGLEHPEVTMHFHYLPPLLRSATVKKFMVGYELMGMPQRDITAETSAEILRNLPSTHYKDRL